MCLCPGSSLEELLFPGSEGHRRIGCGFLGGDETAAAVREIRWAACSVPVGSIGPEALCRHQRGSAVLDPARQSWPSLDERFVGQLDRRLPRRLVPVECHQPGVYERLDEIRLDPDDAHRCGNVFASPRHLFADLHEAGEQATGSILIRGAEALPGGFSRAHQSSCQATEPFVVSKRHCGAGPFVPCASERKLHEGKRSGAARGFGCKRRNQGFFDFGSAQPCRLRNRCCQLFSPHRADRHSGWPGECAKTRRSQRMAEEVGADACDDPEVAVARRRRRGEGRQKRLCFFGRGESEQLLHLVDSDDNP